MTLPIATADSDSECCHYFHNIVSVYEDPVSECCQPTSLDQFEVFTHYCTSCWACKHLQKHKQKTV